MTTRQKLEAVEKQMALLRPQGITRELVRLGVLRDKLIREVYGDNDEETD